MELVQQVFDFWIESHWLIAFVISTIVNIAVFFAAAYSIESLTEILVDKGPNFHWVDDRKLKQNQRQIEIRNALVACSLFALCSLLAREVFTLIWPNTLLDWLIQIVVFTLFYETYSYFIHRLLHHNWLTKYHAVHHSSVRVTPWTAYSVHPIEAFCIGISAPLFMLLFPLSLGVALIFHVFGMMFTIFLHANLTSNNQFSLVKLIFAYPQRHAMHHKNGRVNFGFVNSFWDSLFSTIKK
jgi:sterol desaturase/sphingolipid hydroxylase (fatty acid hydroxylase superfamily)